MKFDKIRFAGATNVDFPIIGASGSGPFVLKNVEGLGPPEINVRMTRTTLEKAQYQGKSVALRQLTVTVGLQPDWDTGQTAEELRTILYGMLTPKFNRMLEGYLMLNGVTKAFVRGHISKMEPTVFAKDPAVVFVMDCDYPYLQAPATIVQTPVQRTVSGLRGFDVENTGTAPTGFQAGFILRSNVGNSLLFYDGAGNGQRIQIDGINWQSGDRFYVDTRAGSRSLMRGAAGGALVSCLNNMNASVTEWIQLYGGDNFLMLNATAFDWDPAYNFRHLPNYWGV